MKNVNKWLKIADDALNTSQIADANGKVKEVYKGYVSSFGAMVIQNGLPAALAINMKSDTEEGRQRKKIIIAIAKILKNSSNSIYSDINETSLLKLSCELANLGDPCKVRLLKEDVINASIALKLMMRTYEFTE